MQKYQLSHAAERIKPSPTIALSTRARELRASGKDVISLTAGEPDFDTPDHIKKAGIDAINKGMTKYTQADGTPEVKQAIIDKFNRENALSYTPEQIIVSAGAKHSIFNLLIAVLNIRDEVIVPSPYWVSYPDMVALAGGEPVIVSAAIDQEFKLTPAQIEKRITERTRMIVLNSPSNPTGAVYSKAELAALGEMLLEHPEILILSDDIYEHVLWGNEPFCNIVNACSQLYDRTIVINGVSKAYAMTGWRIGYAAGPTPIIRAMNKIQSQSTSNPASIAQAAAAEALNGDQSAIGTMVDAYHERHDYVVGRLNDMQGVSCLSCNGTFYAFPDVSGAINAAGDADDDMALAEKLLIEGEVAVVPGSAFGAPGYLRLSFATDMQSLEKAMDRMAEVLS
ncbi:MAG: pyridoxal phosphate-dependent aminotransferase [Gammaproteobacteria bacterium]|nr:pyridoxal phosphate-dependent aminotransferase [Gammaproteobacteria bacterium]